MKATNIEQIREHLARGGRVLHEDENVGRWEIVEAMMGGLKCIANGVSIFLENNIVKPEGFELLPIEEETGIASVCLVCGTEAESIEQCERCNALRKRLLFGQPWSMDEQREVWELLTGERIEHGKRCERCECTGYIQPRITETVHITVGGDEVDRYDVESTPARCKDCNGSGYTVRPTWMGEEATGDE